MILILASAAPSLVNFRGPLIRDLISAGHRVVAAAPQCEGEVARALRGLGAEPFAIGLSRTGMNPVADLDYLRRLRRLFVRLRPDIVIPYTAKPVIWGTIAAYHAGIRTVIPMITGLGYAFSEGREPKRLLVRSVMCRLYRMALKRASAVIFQNPDDRDEFVRLGLVSMDKTGVVAGSGIDLISYPQAPVPQTPSFLMLCRLLLDKGVREYAEAAAMLARWYPGVPMRLYGPADSSPNGVSSQALAQWSGGALEYGGSLQDVRPALAKASVYVLPSYYREGVPRSSLEALATGRAIITTDLPGCRETVIDGENGLLVEARNPAALAQAMRRFVEEPQLAVQMGARSRALAEERFDVRKVNRAILQAAGLGQ